MILGHITRPKTRYRRYFRVDLFSRLYRLAERLHEKRLQGVNVYRVIVYTVIVCRVIVCINKKRSLV